MRKLKITELNRLSCEEYRTVAKIPLVVILDNVRSLHNVGSVFRTADAFRVEHLYLCGITSPPPHPEIHKTALGAEDSVAWTYMKSTMPVVTQLKAAGYGLWGIEQVEGSRSLETFQSAYKKNAIIFGNEVHGIAQEVIDQCNGCIEIPQFGTKHSLNVSVASGIVIWELFSQYALLHQHDNLFG
ncbi:MAG: RNA methyltransferase [Dysgonamonadaceae bacterium]|jgi:tRNA G18 (ribose-2'-O)-methylase SpoU|nr:RNA methyltransferase [Dysgonamonadaceae bacterium]